MAKTIKSFGRFIKIVLNPFLLIFITFILNIIITTMFINLNEIKKIEVESIESLLTKTKSVLEDNMKEIEILKKEIYSLENIDNKISEIKQDFFNNAFLYEQMVLQGKGEKKIAYLTIDDGPYSYTSSFLDVFDKYDVLSTFFLLGKPAETYDSIYRRIANSGHTIGNHTYSHAIKNGLYYNVDTFINDIIKQEKFLYEKTGLKTDILRFPGGSMSTKENYKNQILLKMRELNYGYIDWNISTGDASGNTTKESIYNNVIGGLGNKKIIVILMHDFNRNTLSTLPDIIEKLKNRNFIFLPLFYKSSTIIK